MTPTRTATPTVAIVCHNYDLTYGFGGDVDGSYTTCAGATTGYAFDTGDPGNSGLYAGTLCARVGTVSTSSGGATITDTGVTCT